MTVQKPKRSNPLGELIADDIYHLLKDEGLLDRRAIREFQMETRYRELIKTGITSKDAISLIFTEFPDLEYPAINKILYLKG